MKKVTKKKDIIVNVDKLCDIKMKVMKLVIKEDITIFEAKIVLSEILRDYAEDESKKMMKSFIKKKK